MRLVSVFSSFCLCCFLLLSPFTNIFAQTTPFETSFYQKALLNTKALYQQSFGEQSAIYNGTNANYLVRFDKGHPYFFSPVPGTGSVTYDGIFYDSVLITYDEIKDVVIIASGINRLQLATEKVVSFSIFNADFIKISKDSSSDALIKSGFYQVLYKGNVWLLTKQIKTIREDLSGIQIMRMIDEQDYYYIQKDGRYYLVNKKKNLLKVFSDRKKEIQQFIKVNGIDFRNNWKYALIETTTYYDSLKK